MHFKSSGCINLILTEVDLISCYSIIDRLFWEKLRATVILGTRRPWRPSRRRFTKPVKDTLTANF